MEKLFYSHCSVCDLEVHIQELRECSKCQDFCCYRLCSDKSCRKINCGVAEHATCWASHLPGASKLHVLHEQIDLVKGMYVDIVTYSETEHHRQQQLHDQDQAAQWFVVKKGNEHLRLCLRDRFRELCSPGLSDSGYPSRQYPGFISFVGDTGMGKSTLLRAMILLGLLEQTERYLETQGEPVDSQDDSKLSAMKNFLGQSGTFPVTRAAGLAGIDHLNSPTSYGVHLYKDGGSVISTRGHGLVDLGEIETPILYADCEGFRAGYQMTHAQHADQERQRHSRSVSPQPSVSSARRSPPGHNSRDPPRNRIMNQHLNVNAVNQDGNSNIYEDDPRRIEDPHQYLSEAIITAPSYAHAGKEGIDLFYARLLYTISDVVVFVIKSDSTLLTDLQKLVEWCSVAVHRSVNQIVCKTLVIVRNAASLHDESLYDHSMLYDKLLAGLAPLWNESPALSALRDEHNRTHRSAGSKIQTNKHLLGLFFQEVKVCYIPDIKRAKKIELHDQYRRLRGLLIQASQHSQQERSRAWLQYNTPTLSRILNRAFEHFRKTDRPFDFYDAARNDNPCPASVAEHIENFSRHLSKYKIDIHSEMFTRVVSMCLVTQVLRDATAVFDPNEIFLRELEDKLKLGLRMFQEKHQTCSFRFESGLRCVLKWAPHLNEHADGTGKVVAGWFVHAEQVGDRTLEQLNHAFNEHYTGLCPHRNSLPDPEVLKEEREKLFGEFASQWKSVVSNKTCFACLRDAPDHKLPCGHTFCSLCVSEFGTPSRWFECGWVVERCVLCCQTHHEKRSLFRLHPRCAGFRVLTLDGGGVRGIVEIAILERLAEDLGLEASMSEFFDLIMGTSTGGIISLGLATRNNLSLHEIRRSFLRLAEKSFKRTRGASIMRNLDPLNIVGNAMLVMRLHESVYPTTPLKESLIDIFGISRNLFSPELRQVRVAVTTVKDGGATPCLITNYNRLQSTDVFNIEREDEDQNEFKVWEAGLATSAAPFWFKPFRTTEPARDYVDGALFANLPVSVALEELALISPGSPHLDILVSIGTGIQEKEIQIPKAFRIGGFEHVVTNFQSQLNTEKIWKILQNGGSVLPRYLSRIRRLNSPVTPPGGSYVALDAQSRMQDVHDTVINNSRLRGLSTQIAQSADMLLASLFFFEPDPPGVRDSRRDSISGSIRCRLARGGNPLGRLVLKIAGFWFTEVAKGYQIPVSTADWSELKDAVESAQSARSNEKWLRIECTMQCSNLSNVELVLGITFKTRSNSEEANMRSSPIPISGFPITMEELRRKAGYI